MQQHPYTRKLHITQAWVLSTKEKKMKKKIDSPNAQIYHHWLYWLGTGTSTQSGKVKLVLWAQTSLLSERVQSCKCFPPVSLMPNINVTKYSKNLFSETICEFWVQIPLRRGVLDTTLCDKVCQWHKASRWFSQGNLVSSTNKTDCHDISEILLKVALNP